MSTEEEGVHRLPRDARHGARESEPGARARVQVSARALQPVQPQTGLQRMTLSLNSRFTDSLIASVLLLLLLTIC